MAGHPPPPFPGLGCRRLPEHGGVGRSVCVRVCAAREGAAGVPRPDPAGRGGEGVGARPARRARPPARSQGAGAAAGHRCGHSRREHRRYRGPGERKMKGRREIAALIVSGERRAARCSSVLNASVICLCRIGQLVLFMVLQMLILMVFVDPWSTSGS